MNLAEYISFIQGGVVISEAMPPNPSNGDIWLDTGSADFFIYSGPDKWVRIR